MIPAPVLLVVFALQGWSESGHWKNSLLVEVLENIPGVKVVVVDYLDGKGKLAQFHSHLKAEEYALIAEKFYQQARDDYPNAQILVVGHSLGGIIARILCRKGLFPSKDMVLVGTPNNGITYKMFGGKIIGLVVFPLLWILSAKRACNVPVFRDLLRGSDFLLLLNRAGIPQDAHYIIGLKDKYVEPWSSDPWGVGQSVNGDHHLFPLNGKSLNDLSTKECALFENSAIPAVMDIVSERLAKIKRQ
ncbi:MAG: alpha/beta hydrolase [Candidatus Pacebacteria bacterium]|nr:alpha/beta hydrolase [Candidatus Paceibacterota bacterium]